MRNAAIIIAALLLAAPLAMAQQEPPPQEPKPGPAGGAVGDEAPPQPGKEARQIPGGADLALDDDPLPPGYGAGRVKAAAGPGDLLSRFHPVVVHLTIGWLFLLLIVDLGTFMGKITEWRRAGPLLLLATILSAVPSIITGFLRGGSATGFYKQQLVGLHQNVMYALVGALVVALVLRVRGRNNLSGGPALIYLLLIFTSAFLCLAGGHFGAKMVYGPNYLPF